jgi:hypothetical protein
MSADAMKELATVQTALTAIREAIDEHAQNGLGQRPRVSLIPRAFHFFGASSLATIRLSCQFDLVLPD